MRIWRSWIRGLRGGFLARGRGLILGGLMAGRVGRGICAGALVSFGGCFKWFMGEKGGMWADLDVGLGGAS